MLVDMVQLLHRIRVLILESVQEIEQNMRKHDLKFHDNTVEHRQELIQNRFHHHLSNERYAPPVDHQIMTQVKDFRIVHKQNDYQEVLLLMI